MEVELTRRGIPVAVIISHRTLQQLRRDRPQFRDAYRKFLETHASENAGLDRAFVRSLRSKEQGRKVSL